MSANDILDEIKPLGNEGYKRILQNHGIDEPVLGVKIEYLKKIQKRVKKDYKLALDLYDTGIYDARYLAGLIADDAMMTKKDLEKWVKDANRPLAEYTVAWVSAESNHGWELALKWIDSPQENIAVCGWATLAGVVALKEDADLDLAMLKKLLARVQKTIHHEKNCVRYAMNAFLIAVGCSVKPLSELAVQTSKKIGTVNVDMGNTACKVPSAAEYIKKVEARGTIGKKRKTVKC